MIKPNIFKKLSFLIVTCILSLFSATNIFATGNAPFNVFSMACVSQINGVCNYKAVVGITDYEEYKSDTNTQYLIVIEKENGQKTTQWPVTISEKNEDVLTGEVEVIADSDSGDAKVYLYRYTSDGFKFIAGQEYDFDEVDLSKADGDPIEADPGFTPTDITTYPQPTQPTSTHDDDTPPADTTLDEVNYNDAIQEFAAKATQFIIAIAIISSIFLLPYMGILWGSGNPENIKKATDWFQSWLTGLIFLLLSGIIVRIIGTDILKLTL